MRTALFIGFLAVLVFMLLGCTTKPCTPPAEGVREVLAHLPLEFQDDVMHMNRHDYRRSIRGMEEVDSYHELQALEREQQGRFVEGVAAHMTIYPYAEVLVDKAAFDIDPYAADWDAWADCRGICNGRLNFWMAGGQFDRENIQQVFTSRWGYQKAEHQGIPYVWKYEDYQFSYKERFPRGPVGPFLNRIALPEGGIVIAPATEVMAPIVEAWAGAVPSLLDSPPHVRLADAAGEDVVGMVYLPFSKIPGLSQVTSQGPEEPPAREEFDHWQPLHEYTLAAFGYKESSQGKGDLFLGLYYPDPKAAEADSQNLSARWQEYLAASLERKGQLTSRYLTLETQVVKEEGSSILLGRCGPAPEAQEAKVPTGFWYLLPTVHWMDFLLP